MVDTTEIDLRLSQAHIIKGQAEKAGVPVNDLNKHAAKVYRRAWVTGDKTKLPGEELLRFLAKKDRQDLVKDN